MINIKRQVWKGLALFGSTEFLFRFVLRHVFMILGAYDPAVLIVGNVVVYLV